MRAARLRFAAAWAALLVAAGAQAASWHPAHWTHLLRAGLAAEPEAGCCWDPAEASSLGLGDGAFDEPAPESWQVPLGSADDPMTADWAELVRRSAPANPDAHLRSAVTAGRYAIAPGEVRALGR